MSRYIDADALKEDCFKFANNVSRGTMAFAQGRINSAPTADVVEVRHGEWLKSSPYNRFMNCSVCGFGQNHVNFPYCPNCGADMRGKRRDDEIH